MKKKLDYKLMIDKIDDLVETDFVFDMDCKAIHPEEPFTHEEATKMRDIIMKIYSIAHCNTCTACQGKYIKGKKLKVVKFGNLKLPSGIILE